MENIITVEQLIEFINRVSQFLDNANYKIYRDEDDDTISVTFTDKEGADIANVCITKNIMGANSIGAYVHGAITDSQNLVEYYKSVGDIDDKRNQIIRIYNEIMNREEQQQEE